MVRLRGLHRAAELMPQRQEQPPGQPPEGERPQPPDRKPPPQLPRADAPETPEAPEDFAHLFSQKAGYANYYFNELERERVLNSIRALGDFKGLSGLWTMTGHADDGRAFQFKLAPETVAVKIGDDVRVQQLNQDFGDLPPGSGGLLAALHAMKMMLVAPDDYFSEFYYIGQEPLDGGGPLVDVLWTTRGQLAGRWYFDAINGRWLGFDSGLNEEVDECEIRLDGLRNFGGRTLPQRLTVRHGDTPFAVLQLESVTFPQTR